MNYTAVAEPSAGRDEPGECMFDSHGAVVNVFEEGQVLGPGRDGPRDEMIELML